MSADVRYVLPSSEAESERLERQAELYGGLDFLLPFLAGRPAQILDVGCGTGDFTRRVAERCPGAGVTGLDSDAPRLQFARERDGRPGVRYEQGDLAKLPFEDGRFDLVFCRFVLGHVPEPTRALAEMARVARPGGRVVAYDMVHEGSWFSPEKPAFAQLLREIVRALRERGAEPSQGLHLAPAMVRAGLQDVAAQVIPHSALAGDPRLEAHRRNWLETASGIGEILGERFEAGLLDRARAELERRTPDEFLVELTVVASGTRPAEP